MRRFCDKYACYVTGKSRVCQDDLQSARADIVTGVPYCRWNVNEKTQNPFKSDSKLFQPVGSSDIFYELIHSHTRSEYSFKYIYTTLSGTYLAEVQIT